MHFRVIILPSLQGFHLFPSCRGPLQTFQVYDKSEIHSCRILRTAILLYMSRYIDSQLHRRQEIEPLLADIAARKLMKTRLKA